MGKENSQPNKAKLSPVIAVCMALTLMGIGICVAVGVKDELKMGQAYTLAVVFGDGRKVHETISPKTFWLNIGWQMLSVVLCIILGVGSLYENFSHKQKDAPKKEK